jgi:hypothetical protein
VNLEFIELFVKTVILTLEILEYCNPSDAVSTEQKYLDLLKPEYNILKKAGSLLKWI